MSIFYTVKTITQRDHDHPCSVTYHLKIILIIYYNYYLQILGYLKGSPSMPPFLLSNRQWSQSPSPHEPTCCCATKLIFTAFSQQIASLIPHHTLALSHLQNDPCWKFYYKLPCVCSIPLGEEKTLFSPEPTCLSNTYKSAPGLKLQYLHLKLWVLKTIHMYVCVCLYNPHVCIPINQAWNCYVQQKVSRDKWKQYLRLTVNNNLLHGMLYFFSPAILG